ncbi:MAG: FtsX-like permease family protein [Bacteroidales bacterium]
MLSIRLALKNLLGAGLRTWLNAFVLSLALVLIVFQMGFIQGWNVQAKNDTTDWEVGGGEYWHQSYDPYDALTLNDAHGVIPPELAELGRSGKATPVLVTQASIFPAGRMKNILLKGIDPGQKIIKLPSASLHADSSENLKAIIGTRMAASTGLSKGDIVTIRWRDANGTFDATEIKIADIFHTSVPTVDNNQIWIDLGSLQKMAGMQNSATYIILSREITSQPVASAGWIYLDHNYLFQDIDTIIKEKSIAGVVVYILLLALALLAVFDTQVLSIFRREKEIGTYIALGMTRWQVVRLFTLEGAMNSILSIVLAALWGTPLLWMVAKSGYSLPKGTEGYGLAIAEKIFPAYSLGTVISMALIVMITTTIVSFIPSKKIAGMKPTEALRGKSL